MSALIEPATRRDQVPRERYVSPQELAIRDAVEEWGRARWPRARVVHELVMGRGEVRADLAFISPSHLVAVEIKSDSDVAGRLLRQAGLYQLAFPEVWIVTGDRHTRAGGLVTHLLPSLGLARAVPVTPGPEDWRDPGRRKIAVVKEPQPFAPDPECMLDVLWVAELLAEAQHARVWQRRDGTHAKLAQALSRLTQEERIAAVCRQLRGRNALWRADPPIEPFPPTLLGAQEVTNDREVAQ